MKAICFLLEEEEYHSYTFWVEKPLPFYNKYNF